MKTSLMSEQERTILKAWVEKDVKHFLLRDIKYRIRKHHARLKEDMALMDAAMKKMKMMQAR